MAIIDVIEALNLRIDAGLDLLDSNDVFIEDITQHFNPKKSTIRRTNGQNDPYLIHGTARLAIANEYLWHTQRFRPHITLTDMKTDESYRWNLGIFLGETPEAEGGSSPRVYRVEAYDKLLITRVPYGQTYTVAAAANIIDAVETLLTSLGEPHALDQTAAAVTMPSARVWPVDQSNTYVKIINDLLAMIGYRSLYVDREGTFRSSPFLDVATAPSAWTYDAEASASTVVANYTLTNDLFTVPNKWVFVRNDTDPALTFPTEGDGIYTVTNQSDGVTSIDSRGRTITKVVQVDAASHDALIAQGDVIVETDRQPEVKLDLRTGVNPTHWETDVLTITAPDVGLQAARFVEEGWALPLSGQPMRHILRKVT